MKLYLAGLFASNFDLGGRNFSRLTPIEQQMRLTVKNHLESYHYIKSGRALEKIKFDKVKIFLDSGAYSAFTKKVQVDIRAYCAFCHAHAETIEVASVLDAIGDPIGTFRNQKEMERLGVKALPCFHYGEPEDLLLYYTQHYEYITIGGMVPISTQQLKIWLDRIFSMYLTTPDGRPKLRVHGFGLTSLPLMMRYPWYSVDSSTWVQWAANGMILVPGIGQVNVSEHSSSRKVAGQHIDNISEVHKDILEKTLSYFGAEPDRLRKEYLARWAWNVWAFPWWSKSKNYETDRFVVEQEVLFA